MVSKVDKFFEVYRAELVARYEWTRDKARLDKFIERARATIDGGYNWNPSGDAGLVAYRAIGGKGRVTLKALRELVKE